MIGYDCPECRFRFDCILVSGEFEIKVHPRYPERLSTATHANTIRKASKELVEKVKKYAKCVTFEASNGKSIFYIKEGYVKMLKKMKDDKWTQEFVNTMRKSLNCFNGKAINKQAIDNIKDRLANGY